MLLKPALVEHISHVYHDINPTCLIVIKADLTYYGMSIGLHGWRTGIWEGSDEGLRHWVLYQDP